MEMIDWDSVASKLGYSSEKAMWEELYVSRKTSLNRLAEQFGISRTAIRNCLLRCEVPMRPRGGPHSSIPRRELELLEEQVERDGAVKVAERLHLTLSAVYKRIRRLRQIRKEGNT